MGSTLLSRTDGATLAQRTLQMMDRRGDLGGVRPTLDGAVITVVGQGTTSDSWNSSHSWITFRSLVKDTTPYMSSPRVGGAH